MSKQTNEELYNERREDIARVMDWIELEMDAYPGRADADSDDWSSAGDLGHVLEKLTQTLAFLSNRDPEDIEALLSDRC